jgi:hypothetical protein
MWEEAVVAYLEALSRCLLLGNEENHEKLQTGPPVFRSRFETANSQLQARSLTAAANMLGSTE